MYKNNINIISEYISAYGGFSSLLKSLYLHIAIVLTVLMYNSWYEAYWWESVINIIPSLIGFSLGGYAIFLAFGDSEFQSVLSGKGKNNNSPLIGVSGTFVHFIIIQIIALLLALLCKSFYYPPPTFVLTAFRFFEIDFYLLNRLFKILFWFLSFFAFIYAIVLSIAATLAIFRISKWLDKYHDGKKLIDRKTT